MNFFLENSDCLIYFLLYDRGFDSYSWEYNKIYIQLLSIMIKIKKINKNIIVGIYFLNQLMWRQVSSYTQYSYWMLVVKLMKWL